MAPTTSGGNHKWPILLKMQKLSSIGGQYPQIRDKIIPYRNPIDIDEITHILPNGDDLSDASNTQLVQWPEIVIRFRILLVLNSPFEN